MFRALSRLALAICRGDVEYGAAKCMLIAGPQGVAGINPDRLPFALLAEGKCDVFRVVMVERGAALL